MASPINPNIPAGVSGSNTTRSEGLNAGRQRESAATEAQESASGTENTDRVSLSEAARQSAVGGERDLPAVSLQSSGEALDLVSRLRELIGGDGPQALQAQASQLGSQLPSLLQGAQGA